MFFASIYLKDDANNNIIPQGIPREEQEKLDRRVDECKKQLQQEQEVFDLEHAKAVERLKEEIRIVQEARSKAKSGGSLGSSTSHSLSSVSQVTSDGVEQQQTSDGVEQQQTGSGDESS